MTESQSTAEYDPIEVELVAYLDDELDAEASALVEKRLAEDAAYRLRLQELQKAWDLLDNLPRSQVGEQFTQTTVEVVALGAAADAKQQQARKLQRNWLAAAASLLAAAAAGFAGFLIVSSYASRSDDELVRDLPVIENVDAYQYAESIEFLQALENEGLFAEEVESEL